MRKWTVVSLVAVFALTHVAVTETAVPQLMNYQGILRTSSGAVVPDGLHNATFRLYTTETGGSPIWEEARSVTTESGLFTVLLGTLNPVTELHFAGDAFLGIEVESDGELTPRTKIASVGYAFQAANSDKLNGYQASDLMTSPPGATPFRASVPLAGGGGPTAISLPAGLKHITGISVSIDGSGQVSFYINGSLFYTVVPNGAASSNYVWASGNGAPLYISSEESLQASVTQNSAWVLITGWQY